MSALTRQSCKLAPAQLPGVKTQRIHTQWSSVRPMFASNRAQQRPSVLQAIRSQTTKPEKLHERIQELPSTWDNAKDVFLAMFSKLSQRTALITLGAVLAVTSFAAPAHAARSGGRMGGSSFGRSSFGGSSSSFGRSMGSSSSFGGSSLMGGSRYRSSSALHPRSNVVMNSFFFSPWGFGMGMGYGVGSSMFSLLFWGVFAVIMVQAFRGTLDSGAAGGGSYITEKVTVAKVQVGLLGSARELQRDLERIADRADTNSPDGLHYVLQETVLSLMRNPEYCIYGFAKAGVEDSPEEAEARFNKLSLEERGKFQKETLVNVGGRSRRGSLGGPSAAPGMNELIVVTILVAADGRMKLPRVTGRNELREALSTLGGLGASSILAVEVLWTPEEEGDYFTTDELAIDYPLLNTL